MGQGHNNNKDDIKNEQQEKVTKERSNNKVNNRMSSQPLSVGYILFASSTRIGHTDEWRQLSSSVKAELNGEDNSRGAITQLRWMRA